MDDVLVALAAQADELDGMLRGLDDAGWATPSACPGWTVADVVLHLAQTDEMAAASARGDLAAPPEESGWAPSSEGVAGMAGWGADTRGRWRDPAGMVDTVDDAAALAVAMDRDVPAAAIHERWLRASQASRAALAAVAPGERVRWVAGDLAARTLATTRLAECWIHTGDVAEGLGVERHPTDRIWHIARLAHRTLPYAFARSGESLSAPVIFELTSPLGESEVWTFGDEAGSRAEPADEATAVATAAATFVRGPALELCRVAGQRADAAGTSLTATGPDATRVLELVRTFA